MVGSLARVGTLALLATLLASAKGAQLNAGYLLPGGAVKLDRKAIAASRFCALTFDDGPDAHYTPQVAAVLERYGVPATFFVVGQRVAARPAAVQALHRAGHEIANHSWSHPDFTTLSAAQRRTEITRTQQALVDIGITPRWFRPPFGAFDRSVVKSCEGCGLQPVLWSVDPRDWASPGADKIARRVLDGSGNGAVILLHSTNAQSLEALPRIIEGLHARGYTFLTMTQWEAAAQGRSIPAAGDGPPPSLRELVPLPDAPELPGGPGLLAATPRVEENDADAEWVEAMHPEFYAPVIIGTSPAQPSPAENKDVGAKPASPVAPTSHVAPEGEAGFAPTVEPGPPLFVHGNFGKSDEAEWILDHERAGKVQRTP